MADSWIEKMAVEIVRLAKTDNENLTPQFVAACLEGAAEIKTVKLKMLLGVMYGCLTQEDAKAYAPGRTVQEAEQFLEMIWQAMQ
jgi:hypothetical protein